MRVKDSEALSTVGVEAPAPPRDAVAADALAAVVVATGLRGSQRGIPLALPVLGAALLLGVLSRLLLWEVGWGVNLAIWVGALLLALRLLAARSGVALAGEGRALLLASFLFASALAWRDSPALGALDLLAALTALGLGAYAARGGRLGAAGIAAYLGGLALAAVHAAVGPALLAGEARRTLPPGSSRLRGAAAILRGALLAAPLLLLFGLLFASADPVFARGLDALLGWRAETLVASLLWIAAWGWICAGFLRQLLLAREPHLPPLSRVLPLSLGATEVATVLALLNLLFAAFVLVQFRYLFGGAALIEASVGLSYAEYARRGFFELVWVAALLLPVLLALDALRRRAEAREDGRFRILAGMLVAQLFVVLASAAERMRLYVGEYGLTELRLYTAVFMGWLTVVFLWLLATVLRGRRERFAWGALWSALGALTLLNLANPDGLIVRVNADRARAAVATGGDATAFDAPYAAQLSADAVPVLLAALPALPPPERCRAAAHLLAREARWAERAADWREWNLGAWRARRALRAHAAELRAAACPDAIAAPAASGAAGRPGSEAE